MAARQNAISMGLIPASKTVFENTPIKAQSTAALNIRRYAGIGNYNPSVGRLI